MTLTSGCHGRCHHRSGQEVASVSNSGGLGHGRCWCHVHHRGCHGSEQVASISDSRGLGACKRTTQHQLNSTPLRYQAQHTWLAHQPLHPNSTCTAASCNFCGRNTASLEVATLTAWCHGRCHHGGGQQVASVSDGGGLGACRMAAQHEFQATHAPTSFQNQDECKLLH